MDNMFDQAREMITNLNSKNGNANDAEKHATQKAIEAAYSNATEEEKGHLQELEQTLQSRGLLNDQSDQFS
ncbi:DUF3813 family protein [Aciduricibacillus chroicocephali]|uniref:DUF3813 family protein n=1 Tax=Aciduricibacillus chroicocephali TaxID=3054939 RepID=A0ABY9KXD4_9BACI|nr:DUF3813 family protein [Bacillaceae bacterium 44XB]